MAFEIAIKATQQEIKRLQKRCQVIESNIKESCNFHSLRDKKLNFAYRQGQLEAIIEYSQCGLKKLTPKELAAAKTELIEVKKEIARVNKLNSLDILKETDKQADIEVKIHDLHIELQRLSWMSRH